MQRAPYIRALLRAHRYAPANRVVASMLVRGMTREEIIDEIGLETWSTLRGWYRSGFRSTFAREGVQA